MGKEIKSCAIISGAPEDDFSYYNKYLKDKFIICADSGYMKCLALSVKPDLIIGDFDSAKPPDEDCEIITLQVQKDDTDTFHCVKEALLRGFNDIVILGGIGSRFDHTYANILCLDYCFENNADCVLINSNNKISVKTGKFIVDNKEFEHFSLYALFSSVNVTIKNALYDLDNYLLKPSDQLTQSNGFKNEAAEIIISGGKILLIQCND